MTFARFSGVLFALLKQQDEYTNFNHSEKINHEHLLAQKMSNASTYVQINAHS